MADRPFSASPQTSMPEFPSIIFFTAFRTAA
jgi:hypothetical protein